MGDEVPPDPFRPPDLPDLDRLADNVAGFYMGLQGRGVPEQRAAEFTTTFLQGWIPMLLMSAAQQQADGQ